MSNRRKLRPVAGAPDPLDAAYERLAAAEGALNPFVRVDFAQATLAASANEDNLDEARAIWRAVHPIVNSGTTRERFDELVSVLRAGGSDVVLAFASTAGRAIETDPGRAAVWSALRDLAWAVAGH